VLLHAPTTCHCAFITLHYSLYYITLRYKMTPLWGAFMLQAFLFYPLPSALAVCPSCTLHGSHPASSLVPTAAAGQSCMCLQGGQTCMACHCVWSSRQNPCPSSPAYSDHRMQHHLAHGSYHHACLQLIRISEASEVHIHVKDFAAARFAAASCCNTLHSTCCMQECHALCAQVDLCVHAALSTDNT
jgi:hypothetical protein